MRRRDQTLIPVDDHHVITKRDCRQRHAALMATVKWALASVLGACVTVALPSAAYVAGTKSRVRDLEAKLEAHDAGQKEWREHVTQSLERIERALAELQRANDTAAIPVP